MAIDWLAVYIIGAIVTIGFAMAVCIERDIVTSKSQFAPILLAWPIFWLVFLFRKWF